MAYEHLKVDRRGALLDVTLNRPKKLNALNLDMVRELQSAFDAAEAVSGCVALALRGEGERAFCAGGDIVAVRAAGLEDKPTTPFFREEYALNARTGALRESRVVQCSFWDGFTFGGGVGLSVHGKYRIATEKTQLAMFAAVHKSLLRPRLKHATAPDSLVDLHTGQRSPSASSLMWAPLWRSPPAQAAPASTRP